MLTRDGSQTPLVKIPELTVFGLRAVAAHMPSLLAVSASDRVHVPRLITLLGHVALLATVVAGSAATSLRAVSRHVSV